jgi:isochorismate synthase
MTAAFITRPLRDYVDGAVDLNDVAGDDGVLFVRDGVGFAGVGVTIRVSTQDASAYLASTQCDSTFDHLGTQGIAIGWHSFNGNDGSSIVPAIVVGKAVDSEPWVTFEAGCEHELRRLLDDRLALRSIIRDDSVPNTNFAVRPGVAIDTYLRAVTTVRDAVRRGEIAKAVIARDIIVESSEPISIHTLLKRLKASFGSSYRYSIDGLVGASPELLVERRHEVVSSLPLAGTCARTGNPTLDVQLAAELRASAKNQLEHRVVIDMVHDSLLHWCSYLDWQPEPEVIAVANVQHLGTRIEGRLSEPLPNVTELVKALSPTPALGGHPREEALRLIAECEGFDRGRYGGAVGWCDAFGNGTWAVTIRCAELSANRRVARLFAGGGIVADSEPLSELAETQAKFQAMLAAIVRP